MLAADWQKKLARDRGKAMGFKGADEMKAAQSTVKESNLAESAAGAKGAIGTDKLAAGLGLANAVMGGASGEGGALGSAVSGAAAGAAFGPIGAAVGGIAGGVMGAAGEAAKRKAHNRQVEAQKHRALGEIEQRKGEQLSAAIAAMGQRMAIY
jgi:hypothetical protein